MDEATSLRRTRNAIRKALEAGASRRVRGRRPTEDGWDDAMRATAGDVAAVLRKMPTLPRPGGMAADQYRHFLATLAESVEAAGRPLA